MMTLAQAGWLATAFSIAALLGAASSHLARAWAWLAGWVVVTQRFDAEDGGYFLSFLGERGRRLRSDSGTYSLASTYLRPLGRRHPVVSERLSSTPQLFWFRGRPVRFAPVADEAKMYVRAFSYLRGSFQWDDLMAEFCDWKREKDVDGRSGRRRFTIYYRFGADRDNRQETPASMPYWNPEFAYSGHRLLGGWVFDDLRPPRPATTLGEMSLTPELDSVVMEWQRFLNSKDWYRDRSVPYRRGYAFEGAPGTGKTSLVRAAAEHFDLPVFVFDLSSMTNKDLYAAWRSMGGSTPCVALLEDLDGIFDGRRNVSGDALVGGVTFDALLNCLDGVESQEGVLTVITTNHPERLDPALIDRPGRVDRRVTFEPLDLEGRRKMARRILGPRREVEAERLAVEFSGEPASRFLERCVVEASKEIFEDHPYRGE